MLRNPHSRAVGFKVKTTEPADYCVSPNLARIEPLEEAEIEVVLQKSSRFVRESRGGVSKFVVLAVRSRSRLTPRTPRPAHPSCSPARCGPTTVRSSPSSSRGSRRRRRARPSKALAAPRLPSPSPAALDDPTFSRLACRLVGVWTGRLEARIAPPEPAEEEASRWAPEERLRPSRVVGAAPGGEAAEGGAHIEAASAAASPALPHPHPHLTLTLTLTSTLTLTLTPPR